MLVRRYTCGDLLCVYTYAYIYIYIYRERERLHIYIYTHVYTYTYTYIYNIHIYIYREREKERLLITKRLQSLPDLGLLRVALVLHDLSGTRELPQN